MTLDGTRTYIVGSERPVVIDPGPDDPEHVQALIAALDGTSPVAILLTHAHPDHAEAAIPLARATGAPVQMARGALSSAPPADVWLEDGDQVETDAGTLVALVTPGHVPEHLCFAWGDAIFVGDLLMGEGDTTLVAPPEGDLAAYLDSLDRIDARAATILYPTHGSPIRAPHETVPRFRRHREKRIVSALAALRSAGASGPGGLLDAVYGESVPAGLRPAAEASLAAVLQYLVATGRARMGSDGRFIAIL